MTTPARFTPWEPSIASCRAIWGRPATRSTRTAGRHIWKVFARPGSATVKLTGWPGAIRRISWGSSDNDLLSLSARRDRGRRRSAHRTPSPTCLCGFQFGFGNFFDHLGGFLRFSDTEGDIGLGDDAHDATAVVHDCNSPHLVPLHF